MRLKRSANTTLFWCLLLPGMLLCLDLCAQQKLQDVRISLEFADTPLAEALKIISEKSGISFSFNPRKIPENQKITYKAVDQNLATVLDDLSKQVGLEYTLIENQIILKPEKRKEKNIAPTVTLSGMIRDAKTGEALIGANMLIHELQTGTVSNAFGFYSLTIPKGVYTASVSFVGYSKSTTTLDLNSPTNQDISLKEEPPVLEEIVIRNPLPDVVTEIKSGNTNIRPSTIEERPAFLGEMDVIKSLESIPGVKLHSDGSTFYYVRGGNRDQNLVLIDDAPIYNPSHMLGVFSTIIPDAVNDITMYKGDMPASLGGRLASVLDVRTKKGNDQHLQVWGNTGLISTKIGVEGPIRKDASSFLLSARVSTMKWFFQQLDKNIRQFNFNDLTGKVNVRLNPSNRIFFSFYSGSDNYFNNNNGIAWTNTAATLRWNHIINDRLFLNSTVAASSYDYYLHVDVAAGTRWNSHVSNFNLKTDFSYFISPENEVTFGSNINGYNFNPGNLQSDSPLPASLSISVKNSVEFVLYGNHEMTIGNHWGLNYGVRLSSWTNTGEAFEFIFDQNRNPIDTLYYKKGEQYANYIKAEPRLTLNYLLKDHSSLKASYAHNIQNVHLISNSVSPFTSLEVWLPSSINIKPQVSDQFTLGYYHTSPKIGTSFVAETFYKKMTGQIDYRAHAETLLNPLLERELRFGSATAWGTELLVKKDEGRMRGWAGYTYSRVQRKFDDINDGRPYNAFYDRPHQINLMAAYDISLRWNLGLNWIYSTGAPYSAPVSYYSYNAQEVPVYGEKNNARLPDYHRLDISATFKLNKNSEKKFQHNLSISAFNFYGRKNVLFVNYNKTQVDDGTFKIPANLMDSNRVTSQFYLFRFTPSITYNFKWR